MSAQGPLVPATPPPPPQPTGMGRWGWGAVRLYLIVILILMIFENYLIFPAPRYPSGRWSPTDLHVEDVYFEAADGTRLHGWFVDHPEPVAYVLYMHGNAEHLGYLDWLLADLHQLGFAIFAFDYRGYGRSEGQPSEAGVLADGQAALDWFCQRTGRQPDQITLMGRSIGGAVAVDLAATRGAGALILENTFSSLPDVAAKLYWWAPTRWLLRSRFDSATKIKNYTGPLLISHGTADRIVPIELAQRLFQASPSSKKQFLSFPGGDHNDLPAPHYYDVLVEFLKEAVRGE